MNLKTLPALLAVWALSLAIFSRAEAADLSSASSPSSGAVKWRPFKGRLLIEGSSNIDTWQVESRSLDGLLEAGTDFPAGHPASVRAELWLEARSLRSVEKDGKPFSNKMDDIMHEALKARDHPRIRYRLVQLSPRPSSRRPDAPADFDVQGELVVGGVTNRLTFPVSVVRLAGEQIKLSGNTGLRMSDFQIEPPSPRIALGLIRTGDEVKLSFDWAFARSPGSPPRGGSSH